MKVIITGGTRGIGQATAEIFKREGWDVVATSSKQDVRNYYVCKEVMKEAGSVDCLVNNAGISRDKPLLTMTGDDWQDVLDVNLTGMFNMTKVCLISLLANKGSIVNVSSISGIIGMKGQSNYSASKAGVLGFTKSLAKEYAPKVRVNAVVPGLIETDLTRPHLDQYAKQIKSKIPLRKAGEPEDVAEMIYYLASEKAKYITGSFFTIDGGAG